MADLSSVSSSDLIVELIQRGIDLADLPWEDCGECLRGRLVVTHESRSASALSHTVRVYKRGLEDAAPAPLKLHHPLTTKGAAMKAKKSTQPMIRQGDVCLVPVNALPDGAKAVESKDRVVLAYGEVTGHAHAIYDTTKARLWDAGAERFLQVLTRCELAHEEHTHITLEPGFYHLPQQVEYTPAELRRVAD